MGEFGWAYISGSAPIQSAGGASGSVQIATTSGGITGSSNFIYKNESDNLILTGTLGVKGSVNIQGDITASNFVIQNVTEINAAGSSKFGNTSDDLHQYTGSLVISGKLTASTHVSASTIYGATITASSFVGDGSQITNLPVATGITHTGYGQYRLLTSVNQSSIQGESNLTWQGANLRVTGSILSTSAVNAATLSGSGPNLFNLSATNISAGTLDNTRLPTAINVTDLTGALNASNLVGTVNNARLPSAISVTSFTGDGSALTGISTINIASDGANRLLVADGDGTMTAQSNLTYDGTTLVVNDNTVITGSLIVSGTLTANVLVVSSTGSTIIGNSNDDIHQMTGSVLVKGILSASSHVSASSFIGDGSQITGLPPYGSPAIAYFNSGSQYRLVTAVNTNTAQGESNLTWQGANLRVTGSILTTGGVTATSIAGNGSGLTTLDASNISAGTLDNARLPTDVTVQGKLGVGTTSPGDQPDEKDDLVIGDHTGNRGMTIASTNTGVGTIRFALNTSANDGEGWIDYSGNTKKMRFGTNGLNTRMTIDSAGKVGIGVGSPDHNLTVVGAISSSLAVSASAFYGDGANLLNVGGTITVKEEGSNITAQATSIDFVGAHVTASASGDAVTVTVNAGTGGAIGAAEDGSYTDGLFTDFSAGTAVGTAVDRFNEVLKILAPSPAPGLQQIGVSVGNGITAKLSFGDGVPVTGITSSGTGAGWSPAIDRNEVYTPATDGYKRKLGIYNNQDIYGIINYDIAASITNGNYAYREDSFGNGETGTLKLQLNGGLIHSINLASVTGVGSPPSGTDDSGVNGNGSGFHNVSTTGDTLDGNAADWGSIFKYRSADYIIKAVDQKRGWNYLKVTHTVGSVDAVSNYIEWINDPSPPALTVSNPRVENINLVGSKYFSGVKYNTDATANYKADLNNMYRDVYPNGGNPISFSATNAANPSAVAVAALDGGDNNTKVIAIVAALDCNTNSLLNGSISCNMAATHPLKDDISNAGSATAGGFLIDNRTLVSDWNTENFHDETFRKTSGSYDTQGSVIHADATWNSQTHMNGGGSQDDGLLLYNQTLQSPKQGANSGNFSTLTNGPAGNPNYASLTDSTRTYYRVVSASTGQAYDVKIQTTQGGTTFNNSSLGTGNAHIFVKAPGTTGWMDATQTFVYGNLAEMAGALNPTATNTATTRYLTFGTASVANNDHIMFKIVTDKSWTGNISAIEFTPNVSNATNAAALSTIDVDQDGTNVKLSFGASNTLGTYSNVLGSGIGSMSNIDSNAAYTSSGNRKGVFSSKPTITGDVNGDAGEFRSAYTGSLILKVNGAEKHSVALHTLVSIPAADGQYDTNGNGSGFDLATLTWRQGPANANDYRYPYRTGKYKIHPDDQRVGWNYATVIHRVGGSDTITSYGEWVVDDDGASMSATSVALTNFNHTDIYYQSGIKYFASRPSGSFSYTISNAYKNVYWNGSTGITFPTKTKCTVTNTKATGTGVTTLDAGGDSKSLPNLNNSANCEQQSLHVTGTVLFDNYTSISGAYGSTGFTKHDIAVSGKIKHPFKSDVTTSTLSKSAFIVYSGSIGSTSEATEEYFNTEHYRIVSNAYANQASITAGAQAWNSQTAMNSGGSHDDGLVTVNGYVISPLKIGNAGDTRNVADGGSLQAPAGSPNYSSLSTNTRTFYRYFKNNSGVLKQNSMSINLYGDANLVGKSGALNGSLGANKNMHVELKVSSDPSYTGGDDKSTGWCDTVKAWDNLENLVVDGAGILNGVLTQTVPTGGRSVPLEFQTKGIYSNQYFVVKISVHKDWTGYLSRIRMAYS